MADGIAVITTGTLIHTGEGQLYGILLTASSGNPLCTIYDNTEGSIPKLIELYGAVNHPVYIFFPDRFAPRFATGLYVALAANLTATVWYRGV